MPIVNATADNIPNMPTIFISQSGIQRLLSTLDAHKASKPDCI